MIQQCRTHSSYSFFVHISPDSCNKTYCSVYPLTFSGNTNIYLDVLFSCSNDLGSCQTKMILHYKLKKQLLLASWGAVAIETIRTVRQCLPRLIEGKWWWWWWRWRRAFDGGTAELSASFSLAICCHVNFVYAPINVIQDDLISLLSPFNIGPLLTLWHVSRLQTLKSLNYEQQMVMAFYKNSKQTNGTVNSHLIEERFHYGMTRANHWGMNVGINTGNSSRYQADLGCFIKIFSTKLKPSQIRKHLFKCRTVIFASCCLI